MEISDVAVTVVLADPGMDTEGEQVYPELVATLGQLNVVLVWQDSSGRTKFIAPVEQHRFFQAMKYDQLLAQARESVVLRRS